VLFMRGPLNWLRGRSAIALWPMSLCRMSATVRVGSRSCKNTLPGEVVEKPGPVRSQATIAAISGLMPTMFMTRRSRLAVRNLVLEIRRERHSHSQFCKDT